MDIMQHILGVLIVVPFVGFLFALMAHSGANNQNKNVVQVAGFSVMTNILLLGYVLSGLDPNQKGLQYIASHQWMNIPPIELTLGIDVFSLMIILAIHVVFLICLPFNWTQQKSKVLVSLSLLMLSMLTGFLLSADIFSFYIFFTAMLIPMFILIGTIGEIRKTSWMFRFFIYNFIGSVVLFIVVCALYRYEGQNDSILLSSVAKLRLSRKYEYWIWGGIFIALLSRIPIWPFHYWISSIMGYIQNPLLFLFINLIPLTGIYGFIRFCPKTVPESVSYMLTILEIIAGISMLFISMIGLVHKDSRYKIFSYMTVYYIIFLLGAMLPTGKILLNIGYSLFAFLIIVAALEVLSAYIKDEQQKNHLIMSGLLCRTPRLAFLYTFFVLAAVGFPLSALFVNNFVILSYLFSYNFNMGVLIVLSMVISAASLLKELYTLKDNQYIQPGSTCIEDISIKAHLVLGGVACILIISLCNPLLVIGG